MEEVGQAAQLRAGELIIIVVVLIMWAGNVPLQQRTLITADLVGIRYRKVSEVNSDQSECDEYFVPYRTFGMI